ncbi:Uncharacterised protein [Candidatus Bilamarchaeum dharawalense]|uniref:Uncharacterized protein n=1 Tax=Candidatus Bilamarchaeum dharawalense TaxID=2885759 RepID=A0A5E4LRY0_9ARCH|nr:Uncharacterised protein [Candidatus Bilamarchaeum dharawalense]
MKELDKEWKTTSRLVLGGEVGELEDFREWLIELNNPRFVKKSSVSGKETVFSSSEYQEGSKFLTMDEISSNQRLDPLDINDIKDIDSILNAVRERVSYCGNVILGNSKFIEKSSNITNSFYVYDSVKISDCKNIACSQYLRLCENIFGTNEGGESEYCIRCCILFKNSRSFELWKSTNCSDCYYSFGLDGCKDCIFSFNLQGKNHVIGNLALPKDKYLDIKKKLLGEMREQLIKNKKLPSLVELVSTTEPDYGEVATHVPEYHDDLAADREAVDAAFTKTSELLFSRPLSGRMDDYDGWLRSHNIVPYSVKSVLSKRTVQLSQWPGLSQLPKNRIVTVEEARAISRLAITPEQVERISLANVPEFVGKIAYFPPEERTGTNSNLIECQWGSSAANCYRSVICVYSKNCGYCSWPRSSENCFGCGIVFDSNFSMKCYDSVKLSRCFELDSCSSCTDVYFAHNCENVRDSMFCFNAKNLKNAIGNMQLQPDQYKKLKSAVQNQLWDELESKKDLDLSVFSMGVVK